MTTPSKPSELCARSTYLTRSGRQFGAPNDGPVTNILGIGIPTAAGFELGARISPNAGWLPYLSVCFHLSTAVGLYVLLLDQTQSANQTNSPGPQQPIIVANGDPAIVTLPGPTLVAGSTIFFSESETEAHTFKRVPREEECKTDMRDFAGFPFDQGCIAVLSTTPGLVTLPLGPNEGPVVGGARFTARWQGQR